jgi:hypothetical protein
MEMYEECFCKFATPYLAHYTCRSNWYKEFLVANCWLMLGKLNMKYPPLDEEKANELV